MMIRNGMALLVMLATIHFAEESYAASMAVECTQTALNKLGFSAGPADGLMGSKTRSAASAYASSNGSAKGLPAFSAKSAQSWCETLTSHHQSLGELKQRFKSDGNGGLQDSQHYGTLKVVFASDVSKRHRAVVEKATKQAQAYFVKVLGFELDTRSTMYVSSSPDYLAKVYLKHRNIRESHFTSKRDAFRKWITGEASYDGIFINTSSKHFWVKSDVSRANNVRRTIFHELYHLYQYQLIGPKARQCCNSRLVPSVGPVWLFEGSASYIPRVNEQQLRISGMSGYLRYSKRQIRNLRGASLAKLETRDGMNAVKSAYDIGAYAVHLLVKRKGTKSIATFYRELGKSYSWKDAFATAFGMPVDKFYASFKS